MKTFIIKIMLVTHATVNNACCITDALYMNCDKLYQPCKIIKTFCFHTCNAIASPAYPILSKDFSASLEVPVMYSKASTRSILLASTMLVPIGYLQVSKTTLGWHLASNTILAGYTYIHPPSLTRSPKPHEHMQSSCWDSSE